jgi:uncharacterized protein
MTIQRVVHLELHTSDPGGAQALYAALCGWRPDPVSTAHGSYLALDMGQALGGGIVESVEAPRPLWLPYVQVGDVGSAVGRACALGASVIVPPREGPAGWRAVVSTEAGGELALWQPKR